MQRKYIKKIISILLNIIPIALMIYLVVIIPNDIYLAIIYIGIIVAAFLIKREDNDFFFLFFGIIIMTICEYIFLLTKVETFNRTSLFGLMPIWLPLLWGYSFVVIKRTIKILE